MGFATDVFEPMLSSCWIFGLIFIGTLSIRTIQRAHTKSESDLKAIAESEQQLRCTNERLEITVRQLQETQQQLVEQERLRAIGELACGVAHDLNNALTPLLCYSQILFESLEQPTADQEEWGQSIQKSITNIKSVVDGLRESGISKSNRHESVDLMLLVEQVVQLTRPKWKDEQQQAGRAIRIQTELSRLYAKVNPGELRTVLINLVFNAVQALDEGGAITIKLFRENNHAVVSRNRYRARHDERTNR